MSSASAAIWASSPGQLDSSSGQRVSKLAIGPGSEPVQRTVMFDQPFQRFPGEIEAVEIGIAMFQLGHQPQRMGIVVEAANVLGDGIQRLLAGMAEGRVAQIMRQRHGLGQVFIGGKRARQAARQLRHFQRMGQPGAVIIALMLHKDLGLVLEAAEGAGMDDAVAVAAE